MKNRMIPADADFFAEQVEADFKQFLATDYGLYIHPHQEDKFKQAIYKTCQEFGWQEPKQLLQHLKTDLNCPERIAFIQSVTVDESYFFRDENQQNFLKNEFLPHLIHQKRLQGDKHIRIWSAGCSTGQEIYSIAIFLHQLLDDFSDWQLQLIASDINHHSLKRAIKGEYSPWEIRSNAELVTQSGYFSPSENGRYQLNEMIKKQVKFFFLNLAEDVFPSLMNQTCNLDLILCRNVFIYFQAQVIEQTCTKFAQALRPGGVLLLSVTDPMNLSMPQLRTQHSGDIFYFERFDEYADFTRAKEMTAFNHPSGLNTSVLPEKESLDVPLSEKNLPPAAVQNNSTEGFSFARSKILSSLATHQWQEVLTLSEQALLAEPDNPDLAQFKAKALVNLGRLEEAKTACEKSILLNDLDPHSYLLYGLILLQLNRYDEAERAFRQTIFLNYDFMEAHYQLGQVLLYKGQQKQAVKAIKNALHLAEQGDKHRPVHNVITLTYAVFAQSIKNELSVLGAKE